MPDYKEKSKFKNKNHQKNQNPNTVGFNLAAFNVRFFF